MQSEHDALLSPKEHPVQTGRQTGEQWSQGSGTRAEGAPGGSTGEGRASPSAWGSREERGLQLNLGKWEGESQGVSQLEKHMQRLEGRRELAGGGHVRSVGHTVGRPEAGRPSEAAGETGLTLCRKRVPTIDQTPSILWFISLNPRSKAAPR